MQRHTRRWRPSLASWTSTGIRRCEESDLALQLNANLDQPHFFRAAAFYHLGLLDLVEAEVQAGLDVNPANRIDAVPNACSGNAAPGWVRQAVPLFEELGRLSKGTFDYLLAQAHYYAGDPDGPRGCCGNPRFRSGESPRSRDSRQHPGGSPRAR